MNVFEYIKEALLNNTQYTYGEIKDNNINPDKYILQNCNKEEQEIYNEFNQKDKMRLLNNYNNDVPITESIKRDKKPTKLSGIMGEIIQIC